MDSLLMKRPDLMALPELPVAVELASSDNATELAALLNASFDEDWDSARVHEVLLDDPTVEAVYLIRSDTRVVATASARLLPVVYPNTGYLHWVASDPLVRGRGFGRAVTIAVMQRFADAGLTASVLETDDERLPAITVYLGLGYVPQYRDPSHEGRWSAIFQAMAHRPTGHVAMAR